MLVKVVQLPPFRAISFHARQSTTPEESALQMLQEWAKPKGLLDADPASFQIYGRNNPTPSPNDTLRGYELLLSIPDDFKNVDTVPEIHFPGGLFAVVSSKGIAGLQENYSKIALWIQANAAYTLDHPQDYDYDNSPSLELEQHINPGVKDAESILIDAYVPIKKRH